MAKINSVKIDKNEILKDVFKRKGLPELLSEVNINTDINDSSRELIKKFLFSLKKKFKKDFFSLSRTKQLRYFEQIKIHDKVYQVTLEDFVDENEEFIAYIKKLVKRCSTLNKTITLPDVVKVRIQNGDELYEGYSLLNGEITGSKYHRSERTFTNDRNYGKEYYYLLDLPTLIAETVLVQSLVKFAEDHQDTMQYVIVRNALYRTMPLATSYHFIEDVRSLANKYGLNYKVTTSKGVEIFKLYRYLRSYSAPLPNDFFQELRLIGNEYDVRYDHNETQVQEEYNLFYVTQYKRVPRIPISEEFKQAFLAIANKHHLEYTDATSADEVERLKSIFFGKPTHQIGNKRNALQHELLHVVIHEFLKQSDMAQRKAKEEYDNRSDYAKSYQTKQHIKKETQKVMEKNAFLTHYGYVELDNEVDLKKFKIIEDNFKQLVQFFPIPVRKDYSFRIKKLGHHKAAGIFYPHAKTTIFDLNHPDSYVHEAFHQIDFILGEKLINDDCYSETMHFRSIYDLYKELVISAVNQLPEDHDFKVQWNGKTKFNKNYYLQATEAFARCGEIYVATKGIEANSLFKEKSELSYQAVYPFDPLLVKNITLFFDDLLQKVNTQSSNEEKKQGTKKTASTSQTTFKPSSKEEKIFTASEQLSLF